MVRIENGLSGNFPPERELGEKLKRERIQAVRGVLQSNTNENIRAVGVFGSTAAGTATEASDLDYVIIKDHVTTAEGFFEDDDMELMEEMYTLPFDARPNNTFTLSSIRNRESLSLSRVMLLMYFSTPEELQKQGVTARNYRDARKPLIADWIIVGKSPEEEILIAEDIRNEIDYLKTKR